MKSSTRAEAPPKLASIFTPSYKPVPKPPLAAPRGTRDLISTLPLEVLLLICDHALPASLLALSRTSKPFRQLLFSKARGERFWLAAHKNVDWPGLEAPMSWPAYVELMEGEDKCQMCGEWDDDCEYDVLCKRICYTCRGPNAKFALFEMLELINLGRPKKVLHKSVADCSSGRLRKSRWSFRDDDLIRYVPEVFEQSHILQELEVDARAKGEDPAAAVARYVEERKALLRKLESDSVRLKAYKDAKRAAAAQRNRQLLAARHDMIYEKLAALGYDEDDIDHDALFHEAWWYRIDYNSEDDSNGITSANSAALEAFFDSHEALTHDEWRRVKHYVVAEIANIDRRARAVEAKKARDARRAAVEKLHKQLRERAERSGQESLPTISDFVHFPSVKPLWHPSDAPKRLDITRAQMCDIKEDIRDYAHALKLTLFMRLARVLGAEGEHLPRRVVRALAEGDSPFEDHDWRNGPRPRHAAIRDEDMDPVFDRATALFVCSICGKKLPFASSAWCLGVYAHHSYEHGWRADDDKRYPLVPSCNLPPPEFRAAVRDVADEVASRATATHEDFHTLGAVFRVTTGGGLRKRRVSKKLHSWVWVLDEEYGNEHSYTRRKISHSRYRCVVKLEVDEDRDDDGDAAEADDPHELEFTEEEEEEETE